MSLVHLVMPSARPAAEVNRVMERWLERGYRVILQRDTSDGDQPGAGIHCIHRDYKGYPEAVNFLAKRSLAKDPECQWILCAGDDTLPDPNHTADEIAAQCSEYFGMLSGKYGVGTFGVMQPTGDRWADHLGVIIERIAGSPWMGRSFCERINQGQGPLWPEYMHNWADEELQNVAQKLGVLWQRRDLMQYHNHCRRNGGPWAPHLQGADADYRRFKPLFDARKKMGFPGSDPLSIMAVRP